MTAPLPAFERSKHCGAPGPKTGAPCTRWAGHDSIPPGPVVGEGATNHEARDLEANPGGIAPLIEAWPAAGRPGVPSVDVAAAHRAGYSTERPTIPSAGETATVARRFSDLPPPVPENAADELREGIAAQERSLADLDRAAIRRSLAPEMDSVERGIAAAEAAESEPIPSERDVAAELRQVSDLLEQAGFHPVDDFVLKGAPGSGISYIEFCGPAQPLILRTQILAGKPISWCLLSDIAVDLDGVRLVFRTLGVEVRS